MKGKVVYEGLNLFIGLQGFGKSYVVTDKARKELLKTKNGKKVISNYPIVVKVPLSYKQKITNIILSIYKKEILLFNLFGKQYILQKCIQKNISSYVWRDYYTDEGIKNSLVIIDESGQDKYSGSYAFELTKSDRKFFSRLRHNNISVYMMATSPDDIHPFLRRKLAYIHDITKRNNILTKKPSKFFINTYTSLKDFNKRDEHTIHKKARNTRYAHETLSFSLDVANCYNTYFFRDNRAEPIYTSWYNEESGEINSDIVNPAIKSLAPNIIKDSIITLMRLMKWKKRDATIEFNKIINEYNIEEINTVEKIIKIALLRRSEKEITQDEIYE